MSGSVDRPNDAPGPRARACAACTAPAQVLVVLTSGGGVALCDTHAREYDTALRQVAAVIEDQSSDVRRGTPR
jgi:hypothetical protein